MCAGGSPMRYRLYSVCLICTYWSVLSCPFLWKMAIIGTPFSASPGSLKMKHETTDRSMGGAWPMFIEAAMVYKETSLSCTGVRCA